MKALIQIRIPFELTIPVGIKYQEISIERDDYKILYGVPATSNLLAESSRFTNVMINEKHGVQADVITIVFQKENFNRELNAPSDPPLELIIQILNSFLERLRYISKSYLIKPVDLKDCLVRITYLNDDGSELEKSEGLKRMVIHSPFMFQSTGFESETWNSIFSLPENFNAPAWDTLLIDAEAAFPHIGSAIVLSATALEVFIYDLLEKLIKKTPVPNPLWEWINNRKDWSKGPSVEEQFDVLLKLCTGHSLKDEAVLWERYKNLRSARNNFVHEGVAKIGKNVEAISLLEAQDLVVNARIVLEKIRTWIPEDLRWPEFRHPCKIECKLKQERLLF